MINSQNLIDKICAKINAGGLSSLQTCQTTGALDILSTPVVSVATFSQLPNPVTYAGRMIYVTNESRYYHAVNGIWTNNFESNVVVFCRDLLAWGLNSCGQFGDNTITNRSSPVSVLGVFTDWCQVSAGDLSSLGVRTNGTAWGWGWNTTGNLGDGTTVSRSSPVSIVGGFTDWCQVDGLFYNSIGLRTNGTVWGWGRNTIGQLGDGTTVSRSSPVSTVGGFTNWCQISAGRYHTLGLRTNCTVWAWGRNNDGALGDGTTVNKSSPVSVVGGFTDWCQVSAGARHSLGLRTNGTVWSWGCNTSGQMGDGTTTSRSSPVSVIGGFTDWCRISAGRYHSLGVRTNGTLWSWGRNTGGDLGDGGTTNQSSPVSVVGGFTDWCYISGGRYFSLGVRTNGTLWGWGCNNNGQIGDGTTTNRSSPVSVVGGFTDWYRVGTGCHSLGLRAASKGC